LSEIIISTADANDDHGLMTGWRLTAVTAIFSVLSFKKLFFQPVTVAFALAFAELRGSKYDQRCIFLRCQICIYSGPGQATHQTNDDFFDSNLACVFVCRLRKR
jgi:hypothetical protein